MVKLTTKNKVDPNSKTKYHPTLNAKG